MSDFPLSIYSPRTKENKEGVVYDVDEETTLFAEDITNLDDEVVAVESYLSSLVFFDDFLGGSINSIYTIRNAFSSGAILVGSQTGGIYRFTVGSSPLNNYGLFLGSDDSVSEIKPFLASKNPVVEARIKLSVIPGGYFIFGFAGLGNMLSCTEKAVFYCSNNVNSGLYLTNTMINSISTSNYLSISPTSFHVLRIELTSSDCKFYVDNVLVQTHTTNIPNDENLYFGIWSFRGSSGLVWDCDIDYIKVIQDR